MKTSTDVVRGVVPYIGMSTAGYFTLFIGAVLMLVQIGKTLKAVIMEDCGCGSWLTETNGSTKTK
jgi:hypothetical protein